MISAGYSRVCHELSFDRTRLVRCYLVGLVRFDRHVARLVIIYDIEYDFELAKIGGRVRELGCENRRVGCVEESLSPTRIGCLASTIAVLFVTKTRVWNERPGTELKQPFVEFLSCEVKFRVTRVTQTDTRESERIERD